MKNMKIIDISLPLKSGMLVWPGDEQLKVKTKTYLKKDEITLSKISLGSHTGTHLDAPRHFVPKGETIDEVEAGKFIGPAKVIDLTTFFKAGGPAEIGWAHFGGTTIKKGDRVLLKTGNHQFYPSKKFRQDYVSLSLDAARNLAKRQISLIGIDYVSIEKETKDGYQIHKMLLKAGIIILEGINLEGVKAGNYTLVAAPLKLVGAEASPVRAFLINE